MKNTLQLGTSEDDDFQFLTITLETLLTYKVLETLMSQSVLESVSTSEGCKNFLDVGHTCRGYL